MNYWTKLLTTKVDLDLADEWAVVSRSQFEQFLIETHGLQKKRSLSEVWPQKFRRGLRERAQMLRSWLWMER